MFDGQKSILNRATKKASNWKVNIPHSGGEACP
jgi:hypothetical protein